MQFCPPSALPSLAILRYDMLRSVFSILTSVSTASSDVTLYLGVKENLSLIHTLVANARNAWTRLTVTRRPVATVSTSSILPPRQNRVRSRNPIFITQKYDRNSPIVYLDFCILGNASCKYKYHPFHYHLIIHALRHLHAKERYSHYQLAAIYTVVSSAPYTYDIRLAPPKTKCVLCLRCEK